MPRDDVLWDAVKSSDVPAVEWSASSLPVAYSDALIAMEARVEAIAQGQAAEHVWLLEHPPVYTAGTSARAADVIDPRFPVIATGRGGQHTYHGPGQRIAYVMLDLRRRGPDVRAFVAALEEWLIATLERFGVSGVRRQGRIGVWVARPDKPPADDGRPAEDKIAAIGVRLRHWVSFHGVSLNVEPDLTHFAGIVPCGVAERHLGVTSLVDLGIPAAMADADVALRLAFEAMFGPTTSAEPLI